MEKKICKKCGIEKPISEFRVVKSKYVRGTCKECEYSYYADKTNSKLNVINEAKKGGCIICGENRHPRALDLHHINEDDKKFALCIGKRHSEEAIKEEIKKCVVLCATCHRLVHAGVLKIQDT